MSAALSMARPVFFFHKQKTAYEMRISDWSADVCSSDRRPPSYPTVAEGANALLECWYPGQEGGTAMADILFGDVNPGAKLPVTVARDAGQIPIFYNRKPSARDRKSTRLNSSH